VNDLPEPWPDADRLTTAAQEGFLDRWADLRGRVAVIAGGAGGIGLPITLDLARAGVGVAICDRDPAAVERLTTQLDALGASHVQDVFDVRDSDRLQAFFETVDAAFGRLDILVTVPGGSFRADLLEMTPNGVAAVTNQNFTYALEATQLAARRMIASERGGSIVHITTIEAHRAMPQMAVYGAMKAALSHLVKSAALEFGRHGIRVNAIAPDIFPTEATAALGWTDPDRPEKISALDDAVVIPLGRRGVGRDLSGCVLFLASELASYVTGTTIHLDGGTLVAGGWLHWPDAWHNTVPDQVLRRLVADDGFDEG
jgi:3-oxoacyl-[acyl-carrier protein] reductase